ncbi:protoporphyrinogen/coproporphyrinogen oxidase [Massilibacteroides vaginae]|uniref:protoporphyrinogen/coproporphyrinogen oxidase n=1 Tax=Massilibacteroides vaginae TaxID=1673718 RepID=UPI000A1CDB85|nr:NAD(P)-binding protein [Massilibacteroides vaginae]
MDKINTIAIIGAGVSGLAAARVLNNKRQIQVFEREIKPGGLISCTNEKGVLFHRVGGHVFNSKLPHVLDWFWSIFNKEDFIATKRNAKIALASNKIIGYPIENYLYELEVEVADKIIEELLSLIAEEKDISAHNFESFFLKRFGKTLYEYYFKPYNTKIWKTDLTQISLDWLTGKLPMPTISDIIKMNILRLDESKMVHSTFFYPRRNGSQFLADTLAEGLPIQYNKNIESYQRTNGKWQIEGKQYDAVIYTGDIRDLTTSLPNEVLSSEHKEMVKTLRANGTTVALCEIDANDCSWLYFPDKKILPHRIIYTGNFSPANNGDNKRLTCSIEISGHCSITDFYEELKKMPGNPELLAYNYHPASYVVHTHETKGIINPIKQALETQKFYLLGRMAEWEYYNMDTAIDAAMNIEKRFQENGYR